MLKYQDSESGNGKKILTCMHVYEEDPTGEVCKGSIFQIHKHSDGTYLECALCGHDHNISKMNEA